MQQDFSEDDQTDPKRRAMLDQLDPSGGVQGPGASANSVAPVNTTYAPSPTAPSAANTGIAGGGTPTSPVAPSSPSPYDRATAPGLWQATGNNVAAQDALLQQWGMSPLSANGTGTLPSGEQIDMRRGAKAGDNTAQWMGVGGGAGGGAANGSGVQGPGAGAYATSGGAGGGLDATFRAKLLELMNGKTPSIDDPALAAQSQAFRRSNDRGLQDARAALAERAAFSGANSGGAGSGGYDAALADMGAQAGQQQSGFDAGLVGHEIDAQRQQLSHALDLANAVGARTEAAQLQMQLAQLDNAYRYSALGQQQGQFEDTQAFNWTDWQAKQNRQALLDAMGTH